MTVLLWNILRLSKKKRLCLTKDILGSSSQDDWRIFGIVRTVLISFRAFLDMSAAILQYPDENLTPFCEKKLAGIQICFNCHIG